jgi:polyhydroxyalkanoate synthesis repressor PhaR
VTGTVVIKKYSNRRLYDTSESAYITLEDLAHKVRRGADVRVVDAKTGGDLTQATLAQLILESRHGADLLPVPLLVQLIRMGDDALAEFFGRYLTTALELYLQARQGAPLMPFNPFAPPQGFPTSPFAQGNPFGRMFAGIPGIPGWPEPTPAAPAPAAPPAAPQRAGGNASADDVADLRKELDELKAALRRRKS